MIDQRGHLGSGVVPEDELRVPDISKSGIRGGQPTVPVDADVSGRVQQIQRNR
jgi:hypothetical protein